MALKSHARFPLLPGSRVAPPTISTVRLVGRWCLAPILMGLLGVVACQLTAPPSAPGSPPASAERATSEPSSSAPAGELPLAGAIFGKWLPEPVPIPPNLVPRVDQACRANLGADLPAGAVINLIDARGGGVLQTYYYANVSGGWASCTDMAVDPLGGVSAERGHIVSAGTGDLDPLELEFTDFNWSGEDPITASHLVGRTGPGIARVEIRSPGQPSIVASSANGWWAAWTPGPMPARWSIVALDTLGRAVDAVDGVPQDSRG